MWQQKLAASGVATFHWQHEDSPPPEPPSAEARNHRPSEEKFHNPALAAIRASQQLQELASRGSLNGSEEGVQASIQALHELAAGRDGKFKQESGSESPPPEWTATPNKRRISEVSDVESQPQRTRQPAPVPAPPTIEPLPYYSSASTHPPVLNASLNHLYPSPPPKRRPNPNEDTIGSDLDDSEDEGDINSDVEDDNMPLMLCLYEKVHRTKNKWRATMNHGIVCIDGREWVFEKGNGEYEW
jgi:hypothetical protein